MARSIYSVFSAILFFVSVVTSTAISPTPSSSGCSEGTCPTQSSSLLQAVHKSKKLAAARTTSFAHAGTSNATHSTWLIHHLSAVGNCSNNSGYYVTWNATGGFGNRLEMFVSAMLVAALTNRSVLAPNFTTGHDAGQQVPYSAFITATGVPVVNMPSVKAEQISRQDLPWNPYGCDKDLQKVAEVVRASQARIITIATFWTYWLSSFKQADLFVINEFIASRIEFNAVFNDVADVLIKSRLPVNFAVVHFRITDRFGFALQNCDILQNASNATAQKFANLYDRPGRPLTSKFDEDSRFICTRMEHGKRFVMTTELALSVWQLPKEITHVYVATDGPRDSRTHDLLQQIRERGLVPLMWEDFPPDVVGASTTGSGNLTRDGVFNSNVEQIIAIRAKFFLPSWPSSWDEWVISKRLAAGRSDATEHFNQLQSLKHQWCSQDAQYARV
ncbi:unnamed protein product [Polarella glacialis]|uniref:O-fucosyltransferase family protein n=1 Tax=Polarella glacialis TaxID=89957 RepID=A0A813DKM9_POLGL|nr:unnamed protein product [Polarella glacialis]